MTDTDQAVPQVEIDPEIQILIGIYKEVGYHMCRLALWSDPKSNVEAARLREDGEKIAIKITARLTQTARPSAVLIERIVMWGSSLADRILRNPQAGVLAHQEAESLQSAIADLIAAELDGEGE